MIKVKITEIILKAIMALIMAGMSIIKFIVCIDKLTPEMA